MKYQYGAMTDPMHEIADAVIAEVANDIEIGQCDADFQSVMFHVEEICDSYNNGAPGVYSLIELHLMEMGYACVNPPMLVDPDDLRSCELE